MDINTVRGLSTVFVMLAFIGILWWAVAPRRRKRFDEAANLPFADEDQAEREERAASDSDDDEQKRDGL